MDLEAAGESAKDAAGVGARESLQASFIQESVIERRTRFAYLLSGAAIIGVFFAYLQYSTSAICCGDLDGYYHFKWARLLWESFSTGHLLPSFDALPLTTLNADGYVDHHFLFHVLQIPFTWIGSDLHTGAKISAWFFASLAVFSCFWLIVRYRLRFTLLWLVALLGCSNAFLFRMSMTKAMSFSLALLALGIVLLFENRYRWLGALSFVFVWAYSLWFLLPIAVMIWAGIVLWSERRIAWQPVAWCAAGCIIGLIINPYFPDNIRLFYEHAAMKIAPSGFPTQVGGEWYPYDTLQFIASTGVACAAMLGGYILFDWRDSKRAARPLFFLLFATILMLMTAYSKRYVEYFPPFAVLFLAFTVQSLLTRPKANEAAQLPPDVLDELQPYLDRDAQTADDHREDEQRSADARRYDDEATVLGMTLAVIASIIVVHLALPAPVEYGISLVLILAGLSAYVMLRGWLALVLFVVALGLGFALFGNARNAAREIGDPGAPIAFRSSPERFRDAMAWVRANVPKGELIFNTNWDHFPRLFFESSEHGYTSGLDPNYLLDANRDLAQLYDRIRFNNEENAAQLIKERFGARYIFTDQKKRDDDQNQQFVFDLVRSGWVEEVYDDDYATIYRIRDERGSVPPEYMDDDDAAAAQGDNSEGNEPSADNSNEDDSNEDDSNESASGGSEL